MKPYLSIVMAARNDDFGGNFLHRLQASVHSILELSRRHRLAVELIIMEWNPPDDRARLKDALSWPSAFDPVTVRIIEVPNSIHRRFKNSERIPFFEFFAKNAGIRRAQGEYVLVTNSDIVFSNEMVKFFAARRLADNVFCRADRYDVRGNVPLESHIDEQIAFCRAHTFQIQTMHGAFFTSNAEWFKARVLGRLRRISIKKIGEKISRGLRTLSAPPTTDTGRFQGLYINVGGDFMLLSKRAWDSFKGYPELGVDRGLDCYMTIMCDVAGLLQVVLPHPIYHIDHDRSAQYLRPTAVLENIPEFERMVATGKVIITNPDSWGLGNETLKETVLK